jgi:glycine oxidase
MASMHIRIIGGGVAGLTCAFMLARLGCGVDIFERQAQAGKGCSWYAGGMLAPWCELESAEPLVSEWGQESLAFWQTEFPDTQSFGSLVVAPSRDSAELKRFARRTSEFEWLDNAKISELEPDLDGRFETALYFGKEAHLDPRQTISALTKRLVNEFNVKFHYNTDINEADFADSNYDWTIDCRGFAAHNTLTDLRGVKGEMLILKSVDITLKRPIRLLHPRFPVYIVPRKTEFGEGGLFMVGATMIENAEAGRVTARSIMELLNAAYAVHPAFGEAEIVEMGCDLRPSFLNNLPSIRRGNGNVLHANGLYRHGFLLAPALAKRVADIILSEA